MAKEGPNLASLYGDLKRLGQNGEFEKALKTANRILHMNTAEVKAIQCKIVCYIQLERFEEALATINRNKDQEMDLTFETAYCQYRTNHTEAALKTLRSVPQPDARCRELLAQLLYRKEDYVECLDIYKDLIKNTQDEFEEERETNLSAVVASLQTWGNTDAEELGLKEDTYELCYNAACLSLGRGQYPEAINKLKQAEALCRAMYEDDPDTTEDDIDVELAVIRVQLGFALQKMGKLDEATKQYSFVIKQQQKMNDIALSAVASNNIITLNKDQNVFESQKRIKALQHDKLPQKLTTAQLQAITVNQSLFYMLQNRGEQCRALLTTLQQSAPDSSLPALVEAALCAREKQVQKAVDLLQKRMDDSVQQKLTVAQLYLGQGQVQQACGVLRTLQQQGVHNPGMVSALVTLSMSLDDKKTAAAALQEAVDWYQEHQPASVQYVALVRANANFHLKHGTPMVATAMLEELRKRNPKDLKTMAQLISAYSKFDPKKAQEVSRCLPPSTTMSASLDVDSLENSVSMLGPKYIKKVTSKTETSPSPASPKSGDNILAKKKKKKRKVHLPKNYDPSAEVDAERWLPLRERTYYRGRRRKNRGKEIGKGTQGSVTAAAVAELDKSQPSPVNAAASPTSTSTAQPGSPRSGGGPGSGAASPSPAGAAAAAAAAGPRTQKPGAKTKKKKGKGGKW